MTSKPTLVIIPSVCVARKDGLLFLDDKAISGLDLYREYWPGDVRCIFREGPTSDVLFGHWQHSSSLPFEVTIVPTGSIISDDLLQGAAVVLGSGDNHLDFPLASQCERLRVPLVFVIEYTLETRLQIILLSKAPPIKRFKSLIWSVQAEMRRRRAFASATALQANGIPAASGCARTNSNILANLFQIPGCQKRIWLRILDGT